MGILKLNREILHNPRLWTTDFPTKDVVIDGNSLMYHVWGRDVFHKYTLINDMDKYKVLLKDIIKKLKESGFNPVMVVMDGTTNQQKIPTFIKRQEERCKNLSKIMQFIDVGISPELMTNDINSLVHPFLRYVFVETLKELGLPVKTAFDDADSSVAYMANKHKALIIANDSDYYFMNIIGYVPLFLIENGDVRMYSVRYFLKEHKITPNKLQLISKILGDDFHHPLISPDERGRLDKALVMIRNPGNVQINPIVFEQTPLKVVSVPNVLKDEKLANYINSNIEPRMIDILTCGALFISCDCEDVTKESSMLAGRPVRQYLYHLMNSSFVHEVIRVGDKFTFESVMSSEKNPLTIYEHSNDDNKSSEDSLFINTCRILLNTEKMTNLDLMALIYSYLTPNKNIEVSKINVSTRSIHMMAKYRNILYSCFMYGQWTGTWTSVTTNTISLKNVHYYLNNSSKIVKSDKLHSLFDCILKDNNNINYVVVPEPKQIEIIVPKPIQTNVPKLTKKDKINKKKTESVKTGPEVGNPFSALMNLK